MSERAAAVSVGTSVRLGVALGRCALARRRTLLVALLAIALAASAALLERSVTSSGAVDRALRSVFALVVPLASFAFVTEATERTRLSDAVWPIARFGAGRRGAAVGLVLAAAVVAAVCAAVCALAAVVVAHTASAPPIGIDALVSCRIAALTAAAYVAWFAFGASFFRRGAAWIPLVADFILGGGTGLFGAILPRGNAMNLLGGAPPLGLAQAWSSVLLATMACILTLAAALRCRN